MKNLILILFIAAFTMRVSAQSSCFPVIFECGSNFVDPRDGFSYPTVQIGMQCWMAKNLQATKYVNGDTIPYVSVSGTNASSWTSVTWGAWCDYDNVASNFSTYGPLYNWYALNNSRGLCPGGWHVPSANEWNILVNYLGGQSDAGAQMMSTSVPDGTNTSGFNALPSGGIYCIGMNCPLPGIIGFGGVPPNVPPYLAFFWTSTNYMPSFVWPEIQVSVSYVNTRFTSSPNLAYSVRCLKDN